MTYVCQLFPSPLFDLILQICLLDLLSIRQLISLDVYCGPLVGNAIKCYLNLLAVCFVGALLSSYLFFRFRSAMPPRHSKRTHTTSSEAITVAAATEPTVRSQEIHPVLPWLLVLSSGQINSPAPHYYRLTSWIIGVLDCTGGDPTSFSP